MSGVGVIRVGLFGPYHSNNLGDTATQMAVMANLRRRHAGIEFIGICSDPPDAARTHGISAFQMSGTERRIHEPPSAVIEPDKAGTGANASSLPRWLPYKIFQVVNPIRQSWNILRFAGKIDALLISGGGQLCDFWGGPWTRPFELLAWTAACRLRRKRVIVFATAADNLTTRIGRAMCFLAMRLSHYTVYRDEYTVQAARAAGLAEPGHACPDAAFSLPLPPLVLPASTKLAPVVLACPISKSAWLREINTTYENYLEEFVDTCAQLVADGIIVQLSNSQVKMDMPVAQKVAERLRQRLQADPVLCERVQVMPSRTVGEFVALAGQADVVLASRLHGVILSLVAGTPVVGIAYIRKVAQVMADANLSEHCLELHGSSAQRLTGMVHAALDNQAALRDHIRAINVKFRAALEREYEAIARVLAGAPQPRPDSGKPDA
ncbi:MAG: polysaccharide pyruvyl transferase family protein [Pseudomonadota bacterium]